MDVYPALLDLAELCDQAGVTPRTVRYYIQQGLLPQPGAGREARKYGPAHLNRLRLIRRLQREHLPLTEIRQRLDALTEAEIAEMLEPPSISPTANPSARDYLERVLGPRVPAPANLRQPPAMQLKNRPVEAGPAAPAILAEPVYFGAASGSAPTAEQWPRARDQWERLGLHQDIELHVRRPTSREMNRRIERLLEAARRILNDD